MAAPMRIALVGPEATGKTSLANALRDALGVPVLTDLRIDVLKATACHTLYEAARLRPIWREMLQGQIERESALAGPAVLDNCAIDYWTLWQRWGWCGASPEVSEQAYAATLAAARSYSHIVIMPPRQTAEHKGYRFLNAAHAEQIARLTRAFLAEAALAGGVIPLEPGDAASYREQVLARLRSEPRGA